MTQWDSVGKFADLSLRLSHSSFWILLYPMSTSQQCELWKVKFYKLESSEDMVSWRSWEFKQECCFCCKNSEWRVSKWLYYALVGSRSKLLVSWILESLIFRWWFTYFHSCGLLLELCLPLWPHWCFYWRILSSIFKLKYSQKTFMILSLYSSILISLK